MRPCSERLFLDLVVHYKEFLLQPLLSYFATSTASDSNVVVKEAVYTAVGCAASNNPRAFRLWRIPQDHAGSGRPASKARTPSSSVVGYPFYVVKPVGACHPRHHDLARRVRNLPPFRQPQR